MSQTWSGRSAASDGIDTEIARVRGLNLDGLHARWRMTFRRATPTNLPRHLLFAMVAYQIQAEAFGDLDSDTIRFLNQIDLAPVKAVLLTQSFAQRKRELLPGSVLNREWGGRNYRVTVLEQGFAWEARSYKSLSEIAKAITGTKWNGPRFFGLREVNSRTPENRHGG